MTNELNSFGRLSLFEKYPLSLHVVKTSRILRSLLQNWFINLSIFSLATLEKWPIYSNVTYLISLGSFWSFRFEILLSKYFFLHLSINLLGYKFLKRVIVNFLVSFSKLTWEEQILYALSKSDLIFW